MKRVVVDFDVGTDDAHALLLLLHADQERQIKVEFVICTAGNTDLESVTKNVCRLLEMANRTDIPIYRGAYEPLIESNHEKHDYFHGKDGLGDLEYTCDPDLVSRVKTEHGAVALGKFVEDNPKQISLVCLGPLTTAALTMKLYPCFSENLLEIAAMGGNFQGVGNTTCSAEFNFYFDPEAAFIVFESARCPILLLPWEACLVDRVPMEWRHQVLGKAKNPIIQLLNEAEKNVYGSKTTWLPCDALLAAAYLRPEIILEQEKYHATVELHGRNTRGQLVIDHTNENEPNVMIIKCVKMECFKETVLRAATELKCLKSFKK